MKQATRSPLAISRWRWMFLRKVGRLSWRSPKIRPANSPKKVEAALDIHTVPKCLVPVCDGVNLSPSQRGFLWDRFYTGAPRHARHSKRAQASVASLAKRYGINEKTVLK